MPSFIRKKVKKKTPLPQILILMFFWGIMTVSAVEQLQVMASKRQYKEAAAQLEVL